MKVWKDQMWKIGIAACLMLMHNYIWLWTIGYDGKDICKVLKQETQRALALTHENADITCVDML